MEKEMTLSEFKDWFEGFTESMDGPPTAKQWKRIKRRVSEIDGDPITERIYIDRYIRPYRSWWPNDVWVSAGPLKSYTAGSNSVSNSTANHMTTAGQIEYEALS